MKGFRKITAFFIAVLLAVSCASRTFAAGTNDATRSETDSDEIVATVSLLSCMYLFPISGHTWIYVENLSDKKQTVGLYDVPVGQGVSIGSFAFTASDGWGIYYNLEAYRENRDDNMGNHWSVTKSLTQSELDDLSAEIANYINYWDFYFNCAFFSFSIWNDASGSFLIPLVIPQYHSLR